MHHLSSSLLASSPHIIRVNQTAGNTTDRVPLPPRNATIDTIEDTYVQFILACNPGVPAETDTSILRETFRTPPKSGGRSFSTWTLFQLIAQFQSKEIKTWGELALKLGVEPPDQEKGQSSQKIQQYAVRLKRWMHSMHVDAFFEYLLENPHTYWTEIPTDGNPVHELERDGVAAEDDMALRSLLPHIKPRRGRKRPDEESLSLSSRSPSQKPRMEPSRGDQPGMDGAGNMEHLDHLWPADSETRSGSYLFAQDQFARMSSMNMGEWTGDDFATATHNSMTGNAYASMSPAPTQSLWPEQSGDMKPATTRSRPKNKRHGAKVVSSAWRSGGPGGSGKTRGRPPLNRQSTTTSQSKGQFEPTAAKSPFSGLASVAGQSGNPPSLLQQTNLQAQHAPPIVMDASMANHHHHHPMMSFGSNMPAMTVTATNQPHHRMTIQHNEAVQTPNMRVTGGRLSLQVPERIGGEVRLATPQGQHQVPGVLVSSNSEMGIPGDQTSITAHHHPHSLNLSHRMGGDGGSAMHIMDPYSTATAAAQSMYNMQFHQTHHHHHQHQPMQQHLTQSTRQDSNPLYATTTTALTHSHSSPPQTSIQQPTPGSVTTAPDTTAHQATAGDAYGVHFIDPNDRTNLDAVEAQLTTELLGARWEGGKTDIEEAASVAGAIINHLRREAKNTQGFLMNLAAVTGLGVLKGEGGVRVCRVGEENGERVYEIHWDLRLGDMRSSFSLQESVPVRGRPRPRSSQQGGGGGTMDDDDDAEGEHVLLGVDDDDDEQKQQQQQQQQRGESHERQGLEGGEEEDGEMWRSKYRGLLGVVRSQRVELRELRHGVVDLMRPRASRDGGEDA